MMFMYCGLCWVVVNTHWIQPIRTDTNVSDQAGPPPQKSQDHTKPTTTVTAARKQPAQYDAYFGLII